MRMSDLITKEIIRMLNESGENTAEIQREINTEAGGRTMRVAVAVTFRADVGIRPYGGDIWGCGEIVFVYG